MNRISGRKLGGWAATATALLMSLLHLSLAAAAPAAQGTPTNPGPLAPPIVFILLLALLFAAVLVFSYFSYRNAQR
jgi:membrane protease YdiL (CAAX protease family)